MYRLDVLCFEAPFRFSRGAMRRFTQAEGAFSLVAEAEGAVLVGFIVVQMNGAEGYVVTLDVAHEFRRQGVAGMLLGAAEREVVARGGTSMGLHVWTQNEGAMRFYERDGYARTQFHLEFYDAKRDAYGYIKELS